MQKRRRLVLILIGVGVFVGVLLVVFRPTPEPERGGIKLSQWVERNAHGFYSHLDSPPTKVVTPIHEIGTNAIPLLLKWIRYEPPPWKSKFYNTINAALYRVNPSWEFPNKEDRRASGTVEAFRTLGPQAKGAIPELVRILNDPIAMRSALRAVRALGYLGKDALPALVTVVTNQQGAVRDLAIESIGGLGTNALPAVPALLQMLNETNDSWAKTEATNALRKIDPEALERAAAR